MHIAHGNSVDPDQTAPEGHFLHFHYYFPKKQMHKKQNLGQKKVWNKVCEILV